MRVSLAGRPCCQPLIRCLSCCVKKQKIVDLTGFHCQMLQRFEILIFKSARVSSIPFTSQSESGVEKKSLFQGNQGKQRSSKSRRLAKSKQFPPFARWRTWQLCLLQQCPIIISIESLHSVSLCLLLMLMSVASSGTNFAVTVQRCKWTNIKRGNSRLLTSPRC